MEKGDNDVVLEATVLVVAKTDMDKDDADKVGGNVRYVSAKYTSPFTSNGWLMDSGAHKL